MDGKYILKSCVALLDRSAYHGNKHYLTNIWCRATTPKIQMFIWLAVQNCLCTKFFLLQRCLLSYEAVLCPFCDTKLESTDHLLLQCPSIWKLWWRYLSWWGAVWCIPKIIDNLLYEWQALATGKMQTTFWKALSFGVACGVWLPRNQVNFNVNTVDWDAVFGLILHCLSCWIKVNKSDLKWPHLKC